MESYLLQDLDGFLETIDGILPKDGLIIFMDNKFVEGSSIQIASTDQLGNTYQLRELANGTTHSVLKNFPTQTLIIEKLSGIGIDIQFINLEHSWIVSCRLNKRNTRNAIG